MLKKQAIYASYAQFPQPSLPGEYETAPVAARKKSHRRRPFAAGLPLRGPQSIGHALHDAAAQALDHPARWGVAQSHRESRPRPDLVQALGQLGRTAGPSRSGGRPGRHRGQARRDSSGGSLPGQPAGWIAATARSGATARADRHQARRRAGSRTWPGQARALDLVPALGRFASPALPCPALAWPGLAAGRQAGGRAGWISTRQASRRHRGKLDQLDQVRRDTGRRPLRRSNNLSAGVVAPPCSGSQHLAHLACHLGPVVHQVSGWPGLHLIEPDQAQPLGRPQKTRHKAGSGVPAGDELFSSEPFPALHGHSAGAVPCPPCLS